MQGLLQQLQTLVSIGESSNERDIEPKITELTVLMNNSDDSVASIVTALKNSNVNPIANYYWLLFVFMYAGVYLFQ